MGLCEWEVYSFVLLWDAEIKRRVVDQGDGASLAIC